MPYYLFKNPLMNVSVVCKMYDKCGFLLIDQMSRNKSQCIHQLPAGDIESGIDKTCASIELIGKYESYDIVILSACNIYQKAASHYFVPTVEKVEHYKNQL